MVTWNCAYDYSQGVFHEPFFYGQAYNYMIEAFLAVPLLWSNVPIHIALPIVTSLISLLPFVVLAIIFFRRDYIFWSCLTLAIPVLLPLEYNLLTSMSRGFIQAHLFVPFLFIPLFAPEKKRNVTILFVASSLSFFMNQSSVLIILPIALFVFSYHFKSVSFYLKSLIVIPFYIVDYFAKDYYRLHPERVLHEMVGVELNKETFYASLKNADLFENTFPFFSNWGIIYPFIFILLLVFCIIKRKKKEFLFVFSLLVLLIFTLAVPKIQEFIPDTGVFFTSSRLYLFLPILLVLVLFLVFKKVNFKVLPVFVLMFFCLIMFSLKNFKIDEKVQKNVSESIFPISKTIDLNQTNLALQKVSKNHKINLIVHSISNGWSFVFNAYAFHPLSENMQNEIPVSVTIEGDRRTWLYKEGKFAKNILVNGIVIQDSILQKVDFKRLSIDQVLIKNNKLEVSKLFQSLGIKYGNTPL